MDPSTEFYVCSCFFTHNIFLSEYDLHVTYFDDEQFTNDWKQILANKDCTDLQKVLEKIKMEVNRRKMLGQQYVDRRREISTNYNPLHPHIYQLQDSYFVKEFLDIVNYAKSKTASSEELVKMMSIENAERVFSFQIFTKTFCKEFMEEITCFESTNLPKGRPNTMNNYGVLLNELGFDEKFMTPLRINYLRPITRLLFPDWGGDNLDSHKAFIVKYKIGEDLALNYHYDNAEVTINVSLGKEFTEGSLFFGDMKWVPVDETTCTEYQHKPTCAILHRGQHMHGALPITHGERYNLIIWMRSSETRNKMCPMCDMKPTLVKTVGYGDGFTKQSDVSLCSPL